LRRETPGEERKGRESTKANNGPDHRLRFGTVEAIPSDMQTFSLQYKELNIC